MADLYIKLDSYFNILMVKHKDITLSWGISERIKDLSVNKYYPDGNIEFNTNIGLEAIDVIEGSEHMFTKKQLETMRHLFTMDDLKIRVEVV